MKNNFTYENTKDATHYAINKLGRVNFYNVCSCGNSKLNNAATKNCWSDVGKPTLDLINLTDQTGRGYPTLEWFLKCGFKLEAGDEWSDSKGELIEIGVDEVNAMNFANPVDKICYVKSLHDNRHDLTAIARDEYYSKRGKQWPNNERIDAIGQNGNNGEHYPDESRSPLSPNFNDEDNDAHKLSNIGNVIHNISCSADDDEQQELGQYASYLWDLSKKLGEKDRSHSKPVYTQEMCDNGELPPVGSECLAMFSLDDMPSYWLKARVLMFNKNNAAACYLVDGELLDGKNLLWSCNFKPIDTRTDEEKLRDALIEQAKGYSDSEDELFAKTFAIDSILNSDKFTVTLND